MSRKNDPIQNPSIPPSTREGRAFAVLRELLADALGSARRAGDLLAQTLPNGPEAWSGASTADVIAFAHGHLARALAPEIGPRAVLTFLTALDAELARVDVRMRELAARSRPPAPSEVVPRWSLPAPQTPITPVSVPPDSSVLRRSSVLPRARPSLLLLDEDRYRRASLAQRLLSSGCDVVTVETLADFSAAVGGRDGLDAVLIDVAHTLLPPVVRILLGIPVRIRLVALAHSEPSARGILAAAGATADHVHLTGDAPAELVRMLRSFAGGQ